MNNMQQREEISFLPRDPYHTPGYGGFCPQFKYQFGQTFGRTTRRLLQDEDVPTSGRLVLSEIRRPIDKEDREETKKAALLKSRGRTLGDQKLTEKMVPGYTGFIPKSQHYFGNCYAVNCRNSIAAFESDHQKNDEKLKELRVIGDIQSGKSKQTKDLPPIKTKYVTPLKKVTLQPLSARTSGTSRSVQAPVSPYQLPNEDPMKNFMSGYTGFVPRSRGMIGMSYPIITHEALNMFSDDTHRSKILMQQPVDLTREEQKIVHMTQIYPTETGLIPHYTGHIPGQKFRYGDTFGHGTQDALHHALAESS